MMKLLAWTTMIIMVVAIAGPGVYALELDVEDAMSQFASEVRLLDEELQLLRDPFADQRPREPEPGPSRPSPAPGPTPDDTETVEQEEEISPPGFNINGMVRSGGRVVLIIEDGAVPELLRAGQSYEGYQFVDFADGEAVFRRDGQDFNLQVGGGA